MKKQAFETPSAILEPIILMTFQAPGADVDRIMDAVVKVAPLIMGKYDCNSFQTAAGVERYRPLEGAAAGPEAEVRVRQGTVEISFELPDDMTLSLSVVETIFQVHSYQEPIIRIQTVLSSRSKGLDDSSNPNRWWNTTGDWKAKSAAPPDIEG